MSARYLAPLPGEKFTWGRMLGLLGLHDEHAIHMPPMLMHGRPPFEWVQDLMRGGLVDGDGELYWFPAGLPAALAALRLMWMGAP